MTIFVGNLSHEASEKQLHDLFAAHGTVTSVKIITDENTERPKGFAFVEMADRAAAESAILQLNNSRAYMQTIVVNEARAKDNGFDYANYRSDERY